MGDCMISRSVSSSASRRSIVACNTQLDHLLDYDSDFTLQDDGSDEPACVSSQPTDLPPPKKRKREANVHTQSLELARLPERVFPMSSYLGSEPPLPVRGEHEVLEEFLKLPGIKLNTLYGGSQFTSLDLRDFSIYRPPRSEGGDARLHGELAALQDLCVRPANSTYLFDGIISAGDQQFYVKRVPFKHLSVGGYGDHNAHSVGSDLWIKSFNSAGSKEDTWYRLHNPSREYHRYYQPFLWLANFAKHFVDFLEKHDDVSLSMFFQDFYNWLFGFHGSNTEFQDWMRAYGDTDFRRVIAAHAKFLWSQAGQLGTAYSSHTVWIEIGPKFLAVKEQKIFEMLTVVTPYVYRCFKHLSIGKFLRPLQLKSDSSDSANQDAFVTSASDNQYFTINAGDVVKLPRDIQSQWNDKEPFWYAYVQGVEKTERNQTLKVIWLDFPGHTTCSSMHYPDPYELFFTDHCNCKDYSMPMTDVISKTSVAFFYDSKPLNADFFIRQRFSRQSGAFDSLRQEHMICECRRPEPRISYTAGDTVLVETPSSLGDGAGILEPVELMEATKDGTLQSVRARRLLRRARDFDDVCAPPNELVYSDLFDTVSLAKIYRHCLIRFYSTEDRNNHRIPAPYCRLGTGDAFFISSRVDCASGCVVELSCPPISLKQGFDPGDKSPSRLKGLDIFCGGGNFGRGLEESGVLDIKWAVDINKGAMHTYRANLHDPGSVKLYCGSINDYLAHAFRGGKDALDLVAHRGEVEVIIAGSPCKGFSNANQRINDESALRNNSLVASVLACIDFYRPKYAILENVPTLAKCAKKDQDKNIFSQMLCTLVGMGYQVQQFLLDAWSFGSPQSRSRLFISIAAPGLVPLQPPSASHSHPERVLTRKLGIAANGLPFGQRILNVPTTFSYRTIGQATVDLPVNHDGRETSIQYPDHRTSRTEDDENRLRLSCIPRHPRESSLFTAWVAGLLPQHVIKNYPSFWASKHRSTHGSRAWQRVDRDSLISTITTGCDPADGFMGNWVHWHGDRCMTVLEVRRAQGYPDRDVIVGVPAEQWRIVGNSVSREVALVLGLSLRNAWLQSNEALGNRKLRGSPQVDDLQIFQNLASGSESTTAMAVDPDDFTNVEIKQTKLKSPFTLKGESRDLQPPTPNAIFSSESPDLIVSGRERGLPKFLKGHAKETEMQDVILVRPASKLATKNPTQPQLIEISSDSSVPPKKRSRRRLVQKPRVRNFLDELTNTSASTSFAPTLVQKSIRSRETVTVQTTITKRQGTSIQRESITSRRERVTTTLQASKVVSAAEYARRKGLLRGMSTLSVRNEEPEREISRDGAVIVLD